MNWTDIHFSHLRTRFPVLIHIDTLPFQTQIKKLEPTVLHLMSHMRNLVKAAFALLHLSLLENFFSHTGVQCLE
jgi:hypothetical protein